MDEKYIEERIKTLVKDYNNIMDSLTKLDSDRQSLVTQSIAIKGAIEELHNAKNRDNKESVEPTENSESKK